MYKKIGIQNFRVFKDYTEFEIRPITLLTGPNNSGKSSFTKLLMLLKNGIQNVNFEAGSHNLESFEKVLTWSGESKDILLEFNNSIPILDDSFKTQLQLTKGELSKISLSSSRDVLLTVEFQEDRSLLEYGTIDYPKFVNLNIKYLIDLIYNKDILVEDKKNKNEGISNPDEFVIKSLSDIEISEDSEDLSISRLNEFLLNNVAFFNQTQAFHLRNQTLINEIDSLSKDYLVYDILIFGNSLSQDQKEIVLEIQDEVFANLIFGNSIGMKSGSKDFKKSFDILIENISYSAKIEVLERVKEHFGFEDITIKESTLGRLIFKELIFETSFEHYTSQPFVIKENEVKKYKNIRFLETVFDQFKNVKLELSDYLDEIFYISPNRGKQQRVLMNSSDNEIDEIVLQFSKLHKSNQNLPFIKEALTILGIEGELDIKRFENFISVISLNQNQKNITLADLGYGYSQIIPILLKIVLVNQGFYPTSILIIEEPESNLHPDLQSKLADIISLSLNEYPGINFIIETHSEYLIRKLQYLTAKKELQPEESIIYYFNADKYVSREEPKVKKIEITPTGNLTDTFGPGFYDEATRLKFDLMKINKEQNN